MRQVIYIAAFAVCVGIILRALQNFAHFWKNIRLFVRAQNIRREDVAPQRHFYLIIPVLREQAVIADTLRYFATIDFDPKYFSVIVVTTAREADDHQRNRRRLPALAHDLNQGISRAKLLDTYAGIFDRQTLLDTWSQWQRKPEDQIITALTKSHDQYVLTKDIAETAATDINQAMGCGLVRVIEYPSLHGVMAHQINYAAKSVAAADEDYIGVYNADSRPPRQTLLQAEQLITQRSVQQVPVIQQSSLFMLNVTDVSRGYAWKANAYHQSLWTMKHEATMLRLQHAHALQSKTASSWLSRLWHTRFSVCVGHGLFVNAAYYAHMPLSETSVIEDSSYGLQQCLNQVPIAQLHALENSESPESLRWVIRQKRTWFRLIFDLWRIHKAALHKEIATTLTTIEILALLTQVALIYVFWFFHSLAILFPLGVAVYLQNGWLLGLWVLTLFVYWLLPALVLDAHLPQLVGQKALGKWRMIQLFVLGLPGIVTHSVGPWLSIYDRLRQRFGIQVEKQKTER